MPNSIFIPFGYNKLLQKAPAVNPEFTGTKVGVYYR